MKNSKIWGHLALFCATASWGLMAPVGKLVMAAGIITPLLLTNFRIVGAAVLFWIASLFSKPEKMARKDIILLAGAGLLGIVLNQGGYIFGVSFTSPGEASIITTTSPIWVMLLAALFLKEPITWLKGGGIAVGACGALILVYEGGNLAQGGDNPLLGDLLVWGAQICYALYLTLYKGIIVRYSVISVMKWMFTFAAIAMICGSFPAYLATDWSAVTAPELLGSAYVVVFATFLAYICIAIGQKRLRPTLVGMYNYVQPIVASLVGVYLGLDRFTLVKALAVVLIFSGVFLVTKSRAAKSDAESAPEDTLQRQPE